jgi:hypothetical protein
MQMLKKQVKKNEEKFKTELKYGVSRASAIQRKSTK